MNEKSERLLEELVSVLKKKEDLRQVRDQLFKRGLECLLKVEHTAHLDY